MAALLPTNLYRESGARFIGTGGIRNRTTILGRLQVGEFSSIMGLIKRAQTMYGRLFTVSGVICAFRKSVVASVGWWSPRTLTDDVDITWRVQMSGWRVVYEPNAIVWILMPETLIGLWRQRLRWAEGGAQVAIDYFLPLVRGRVAPGMSVIYIDFVMSVTWAYAIVFTLALGLLWTLGFTPHLMEQGLALVPEWWGLTLALTYLVQAVVSHLIERRYERNMLRNLFWIIWYPLAFWLLSALTSVVALPRAILLRRAGRTKWVSPDRGLR